MTNFQQDYILMTLDRNFVNEKYFYLIKVANLG